MDSGAGRLEIVERDKAGKTTSIYFQTTSKEGELPRIIVAPPAIKLPLWERVLAVFLPTGFPQSVTSDYIEYQIYDSLQAFSSSIAGLLASRAVLEGVGVGDSSASPTAAILYTVLQETMGRIATILFAHRLGTSLEPECKMYRLAADVFNDTAMVLDYLSPVFPRPARVMILSLSSVLRALCGVAAGSAKATLSAHFARWHNLGDLNAKDSSQETVISLMGMLVGSIMVSHVVSTGATWVCLLLLLSIHLYTNYLAVRAVQMTTLNRQRATIAFSHLIDLSEALSPAEVALKERIFETEIIRWRSAEVIGSCRFGAPLSVLLSLLPTPNSATKSSRTDALDLAILLDIFREQQYILWIDLKHCKTVIVIKQGCSVHSQLKAWLHALVLHHAVATQSPSGSKVSDVVKLVADSLKIVEANSEGFLDRLRAKGWDTSTPALETMSSYRISVEGAKNAFKPEVSVPKMPYIRPSGGMDSASGPELGN